MKYFPLKYLRQLWPWLKKSLVIFSLPLLIGTAVYQLFLDRKDQFEAHAKLALLSPSELSHLFPHADTTCLQGILSQEALKELVLAPPLLIRWSEALTAASLKDSSATFGDLPPEMLPYLAERLQRHQKASGDIELDSLLQQLIQRTGHTPAQLAPALSISLEASGLKVGMTDTDSVRVLHRVNSYCQTLLEYFHTISLQRLEQSLQGLEHLALEKRTLWQQQKERLRRQQDEWKWGDSPAQQSLLRMIEQLRSRKKALLEQLQQQAPRQAQGRQVLTVRHVPASPPLYSQHQDPIRQQIQTLQQRMDSLQLQLKQAESNWLKGQTQQVAQAEKAFRDTEAEIEAVKRVQPHLDQLLQVQQWARLDRAHPQAKLWLALLSGLAMMMLWLTFLIRIEFIP